MQEQKTKEKITIHNANLRFFRDGAWIIFNQENPGPWTSNPREMPHYPMWRFCLKWLKKKGFMFYIDARFAEQFACLAKYWRWGFANDLECTIQIYQMGLEIRFFQNQKKENPFGGEHDFDKYKKMPEYIRVFFEEITQQLIQELVKTFHLKFYDQSEIRFPPMTSEEHIVKHYAESCNDKITSLSDIEKYISPYDREYGNFKNAKKEPLECGQHRKFIADQNGTINEGTIYWHNGNMWWVIVDRFNYRCIANFDILELC